MSRNSEKVLWFAAGAMMGAAVALLVAPESGQELRGHIGERASEGRDALLRRGQRMFEQGKELFDQGRRIAEDAAAMFEEGKELLEQDIAGDNV